MTDPRTTERDVAETDPPPDEWEWCDEDCPEDCMADHQGEE